MADTITQLYARLRPLIQRDMAIASGIVTPTSGGEGGITDHGLLAGLGDDDHLQYLTNARGDARYIPATRQVATMDGLQGGGNLTADRTLSVDSTVVRTSRRIDTGDGLGGGGDLSANRTLTLLVHDILARHSISGGANFDVIGQTASSTLGRLTPSFDPAAAAKLLRTDASGYLTLLRLTLTDRLYTPLITTAVGNLVLDASSSIVQVDDDLLVDQDAGITRHLAVATDVLRVDGLNKAVGVNVIPDGAAGLDIRAGAPSDHSQRIKQIAAQTGRLWRIENASGQELIVLDSQGNLQSGNPGFVSGLAGWRMSPIGNLEANNGRFRGEVHAAVFVFDEINVQNGTNLITKHGGALELDMTLTSTSTVIQRNVETTEFVDQNFLNVESAEFVDVRLSQEVIENRLHVKNPDTGSYKLFSVGEVLRMKTWTGTAITDTWMTVNGAQDEGTHWSYAVTVRSGTLPVTYTAGAAVAGYGNPGDGAIRLSADDPYGPLIDIFTIGEEPWNGQIYPHVRLGRLDGVGVPGVSGILQWGLVAGANLADANSPYVVLSNLQQYMFKVKSEWQDGVNVTGRIEPSGRARFGTNVDNPLTTFMDVDPATGLATFRGAIEVLSGTIPSGVVSGLGALATQNDLDGVPNGSTYARVNSTLISGGNIRVGSGVKDSTLDGFHLDSGEFVGQLSGVDQVVMGTNGKISAGGGAVLLDANGIYVEGGAASYSTVSEPGYNPTPYAVTNARKIKFSEPSYGVRVYGRKTDYVYPAEPPSPIRNDDYYELVIDATKPSDVTGGSYPTNNYYFYSRLWVNLDSIVIAAGGERIRADSTGVRLQGALWHNGQEVRSVQTTAW